MASHPSRTPRSVFLDSSVFFAAAYSVTGSAHELLQAAFHGRVSLVLSEYVLAETERNLLESAPRAHPAFLRLRATLPYRLSNPSKRLVEKAATVVVAKDAPIIAAARSARVSLVATYDRKDLLSKQQAIHGAFAITVATPEEILLALGQR
jgi:predicted nucleic acid-binding protein